MSVPDFAEEAKLADDDIRHYAPQLDTLFVRLAQRPQRTIKKRDILRRLHF